MPRSRTSVYRIISYDYLLERTAGEQLLRSGLPDFRSCFHSALVRNSMIYKGFYRSNSDCIINFYFCSVKFAQEIFSRQRRVPRTNLFPGLWFQDQCDETDNSGTIRLSGTGQFGGQPLFIASSPTSKIGFMHQFNTKILAGVI